MGTPLQVTGERRLFVQLQDQPESFLWPRMQGQQWVPSLWEDELPQREAQAVPARLLSLAWFSSSSEDVTFADAQSVLEGAGRVSAGPGPGLLCSVLAPSQRCADCCVQCACC